jgi:hypothetical protein
MNVILSHGNGNGLFGCDLRVMEMVRMCMDHHQVANSLNCYMVVDEGLHACSWPYDQLTRSPMFCAWAVESMLTAHF